MTDDAKKHGAIGGKLRAKKLSPTERSQIALEGARARWAKAGVEINTPVPAAYGSPDRPLRIGKAEIPAYVLEDGRRVLSQRGLQSALGFSRSGGKGGARRLAGFFRSLEAKGVGTKDLLARAESEIRFLPPRGGPAVGYEATILPDICDVIIAAAEAGRLTSSQRHLAVQADILRRGFAKLGIIALVDEATGYQQDRPKHQLAEILDAFIAKELRPWVRRFPFDFYEQIYRLKGWDTSELSPGSPKKVEVGKITVELIYRRLAPGVRPELKRLTPRGKKGYLSHKLFQRLTGEIGDPKLEKLIAVVTAVMTLSPDWPTMMANLEKAGVRRYSDNLELALDGRGHDEATLALPASTSSLASPSPESEVSRAS